MRGGYSRRTANRIASENLSKPDIRTLIDREMEDRARRTEITIDNVVRELAVIAFTTAQAGPAGTVTHVRIADKLRALELLGKHLGMFREAQQEPTSPAVTIDASAGWGSNGQPKRTRVTICPKMTPVLTTTQRAQQQRQRAMAARAAVRRSKAWASEAASIAAQTLWRVASTWIEQSDGTHCAEFTHVCTGQSRVVTLSSLLHPTSDARQTEVLRRLSGVEPTAAASIQS
jgi:phage terminase small subunit